VRDVRTATTVRAKLGHIFMPPGWAPSTKSGEPSNAPRVAAAGASPSV